MNNFLNLRIVNSLIITVVALTLMVSCSGQTKHAKLVLINGNIITVDSNNTIAEAVAMVDDTIMFVGSNMDIEKLISDSTKVIDLKGKTALPGFIDSHAHLIGTGKNHLVLNLRSAKNWDEVVYLVSNAVSNAKHGDWIIGRGWHQEKWKPMPSVNLDGYPYHHKLSEASPNNPVMLSHASGHAIFANLKAMQIANITSNTKDPHGGKILKDSTGSPIGVFMEEAGSLISGSYNNFLSNKSANDILNEKKKAIRLAIDECLSKGITTFHDAGASFEDLRVIKEMADSNQIKIRLYEMILDSFENINDSLRAFQTVGYADNHLTVRSIKLFMDGALGSRGAWLLNPYTDAPDQSGLNVTPISELRKIAKLAFDNDFQVCTHAIGDRGNREILDIYENYLSEGNNQSNLRWRVEHAQHLSPKDIPRFTKLGIIASMQGIHCTSDAPFVEKRLGKKRAESGAYVWKKLIDHGTLICNGTDSPVEAIDPLNNFYSLVTRKLTDGSEFYPDQKMSRLEAIRSYTINGAYSAFEEDLKGSLENGKLADIVIVSGDLLSIPDEEILNLDVTHTIVGGEVLYSK